MQVLSSNEFLRRRIRKETPFFIFPLSKFFFLVPLYFLLLFFFNVTLGSWMFISQGVSCQLAVPLIIHERRDGILS